MPSKSPAQHRLMEAAAHTLGGYGGVPQKVGKDFAAADARTAHMARRSAHGLTQHEIAKEFKTSRSTVGRKLRGATPEKPDVMRGGYTRGGSAR